MREKLSQVQQNKIQFLRGLAIIAVIFIHNTPSGVPQIFCRPFVNFSVGLFLFLSGMLTSAGNWNPLKRIKKVLIPYVLWTLIYTALAYYREPLQIPIAFVKYLVTANSAKMMYYVLVYVQLTLLVPLIDRLARSSGWYLGFLVSPIEIVLFRLIPHIMGYSTSAYIKSIMRISCLGWFIYFYFGYLIGNSIINIKLSSLALALLWAISIGLQMAEGYWQYSNGFGNCGTQLKLTSLLSGILFASLSYKYIISDKYYRSKTIEWIGNISFGIYFSHIAVMGVLDRVPGYKDIVYYPFNAVIVVVISAVCVTIGKRLLGKHGKYLAL